MIALLLVCFHRPAPYAESHFEIAIDSSAVRNDFRKSGFYKINLEFNVLVNWSAATRRVTSLEHQVERKVSDRVPNF